MGYIYYFPIVNWFNNIKVIAFEYEIKPHKHGASAINSFKSKEKLHNKNMFFNNLFQKIYLFFLLLSGCTATVYAQEKTYEIKNFSVRDGLPGRLVLDITRDQSGLFWLATNKGLSRFDGYEFINFNNYDYSLGIEDQEFHMSSIENGNGQFVIAHGNEELALELFSLNTFTPIQLDLSVFPNKISSIYTKKKGDTFIATEEKGSIKVWRLLADLTFEEVIHLEVPKQKKSRKINLFVDSNNNYWLSLSDNGLFHFSKNGRLEKQYAQSDFSNKNNNNFEIVFFHEDQQNQIWLTFKDEEGVYKLGKEQTRFQKPTELNQEVFYSKVWEDAQGNLLFKIAPHLNAAHLQNLVCLTPDGTQTSFPELRASLRFVSAIYGRNFFEMMLAGTPSGLKIFTKNQPAFQNFVKEEVEPGNWGMIIRGIAGDNKGNIYFGAENGVLFHFNKSTQITSSLPFNRYTYLKDGETYAGGRTIYLDKQDNLWSLGNNSTTHTYLHRFNLKTKQTETTVFEGIVENFFFDGKRFFYFFNVNQTLEDAKSLLTYDLQTKKFSPWLDQNGNNPLTDKRTRSFYADDGSIFWIGTTDGLVKINLEKKEFESISLKYENGERYNSQEVIAIMPIGEELWVGTNNGFLAIDIVKNSIIETFTPEDGLVSKSVCGILSDKDQNLWLSTFDGLSFYDRKNKTFKNFFEKDGLSHYEFNRMAFYKDSDKFYFGGMNGVNAFDAEILLAKKTENHLALTRLIKSFVDRDTQEVLVAGLDKKQTIVMEPNYAFFEFHFSMPNFLSEEIRYSAWLENYEQGWNFLGPVPKVRYSKLPAGDYKLHIKAIDDKGNPSQNELLIPIFIREYFYNQLWFRALISSLLAFGIWGLIRYDTNQKLKAERLRTKLSSDLHDEVSGLLAGIAMQTDLMQMTIQEGKNKTQLAKIGQTSRSAMSRMGDVIWSVDARKDKLGDLFLRMQEHTSEILQPLDINFRFDIGKFNVQKKINLSIRQNLYLIFKEAINNVAKHSTASMVDISLKNDGNKFLMRIKNNGEAKNIQKSFKTGQGLTNFKMRAAQVNGELTILNKDGFEVLLKMKRFA